MVLSLIQMMFYGSAVLHMLFVCVCVWKYSSSSTSPTTITIIVVISIIITILFCKPIVIQQNSLTGKLDCEGFFLY